MSKLRRLLFGRLKSRLISDWSFKTYLGALGAAFIGCVSISSSAYSVDAVKTTESTDSNLPNDFSALRVATVADPVRTSVPANSKISAKRSAPPRRSGRRHEDPSTTVTTIGEDQRFHNIGDVLSPSAAEISDLIQLSPMLSRLKQEQADGKRQPMDHSSTPGAPWAPGAPISTGEPGSSAPASKADRSLPSNQPSIDSESMKPGDMAHFQTIQRLIYLRMKINTYLQTNHLEVQTVLGRLNSGLADLADRKAMISDQRALTLRRQSFINLISGGLTKIGGYSIALTGASSIPTSILEVFDGGVQTSLTAFSLKQQREERKLSKTRPAILNAFLNGNNISSQEFPPTVWSYLNNLAARATDGKTRRQALIDHWVSIGRLSNDASQKSAKSHITGMVPTFNQSFHIDELDDTVAMMSDLKSVLSGMEGGLMELGQSVRESYKEDPEI